MKFLILLSSLLVLTLLQEAFSTHLETCECNQIRNLVDTTVKKAMSQLEDRLLEHFNLTLENQVNIFEDRLDTTMKKFLKPIKEQLDFHLPSPSMLGTKEHPVKSCQNLHKINPKSPSGYYWIKQSSGSPVRVYCSMSGTCGNETGGWMRVANIDMRNTSQSCPRGLYLLTSPKRVCDTSSYGCVSNTFSVQGIQYSKVCGKVIAYHKGIPHGFNYGSRGINGVYIHGVSLTHGRNPRKHIWSFAGALDETINSYHFKCPCINTAFTSSRVPSFVGNDYFCDTAYSNIYTSYSPYSLQTGDPLWDGKGCGYRNTCCSFNSPPWFVKNLPSTATDNIEMRMCRPTSHGLPLEIVELFVQ